MVTGITHPVVAEVCDRLAGASTGNQLALVIAGGGMRGVVAAAMLAGLEDVGVSPSVFDQVYGVSAGAVAGAYFATGSVGEVLHLYWEHLPALGFIRPARMLTGGPFMDLGVLFDDVMRVREPLDIDAVLRFGRLHVVAGSTATVGPVVLGPATSKDELLTHLRASCHVPVLAGRAPKLGGVTFFDGCLVEPIPCRSALAGGATHVLVLSTTPAGSARSRQSPPEYLLSRLYDLRFPGAHASVSGQVAASEVLRTELVRGTESLSGPPYLLEVAPAPAATPGPLCRDRAVLQHAAAEARDQIARLFVAARSQSG